MGFRRNFPVRSIIGDKILEQVSHIVFLGYDIKSEHDDKIINYDKIIKHPTICVDPVQNKT